MARQQPKLQVIHIHLETTKKCEYRERNWGVHKALERGGGTGRGLELATQLREVGLPTLSNMFISSCGSSGGLELATRIRVCRRV